MTDDHRERFLSLSFPTFFGNFLGEKKKEVKKFPFFALKKLFHSSVCYGCRRNFFISVSDFAEGRLYFFSCPSEPLITRYRLPSVIKKDAANCQENFSPRNSMENNIANTSERYPKAPSTPAGRYFVAPTHAGMAKPAATVPR